MGRGGKRSKRRGGDGKARTSEPVLAHPRRMGHERALEAPGMREVAESLVRRLRRAPGEEPELLTTTMLRTLPECRRLREQIKRRIELFADEIPNPSSSLNIASVHLECAVNYELAVRKAFWVDAALAELLRQTNLDVPGDLLRLPFAACAFLFDDAETLKTLAMLAADSRHPEAPPFRMLTVYVFSVPPEVGTPGLRMVLLGDALDDEIPYLMHQVIATDGARNLDEVLTAHPNSQSAAGNDSAAWRALTQLVINAILYTTCSDFAYETRTPPRQPRPRKATSFQRRFGGGADKLSGETVFYLPAKISIDRTKAPGGLDRARDGGATLSKRFWVRGHWRRPNPSWKDQRVRWIAPYLKGPELTAIVERHYRMRSDGYESS